jgi:hypothetical protein
MQKIHPGKIKDSWQGSSAKCSTRHGEYVLDTFGINKKGKLFYDHISANIVKKTSEILVVQ